MIIIIAAIAENGVIGRDGGLPWDVPEDYQLFLDTIRGQTAIMGRRTWEHSKDALTSAHTIVLSRSLEEAPGAQVARSLEEALASAKGRGTDIYVSGGATVYEQALPLADTLYLSRIEGTYEGDTYFPEFDRSDWELESREDHGRFVFEIYQRVQET